MRGKSIKKKSYRAGAARGWRGCVDMKEKKKDIHLAREQEGYACLEIGIR